jgi:uncharacterized SAM-binding protein YcdF (DUF218 family)
VFFQEESELFLPTAVYFVVFVLGFCIYAFRSADSKLRRIRYFLAILFAWSYIFTVPVLANMLIMNLEQKYPRSAATTANGTGLIVVLASDNSHSVTGDGLIENNLDKDGWERTYAGAQLWKQIGGKLLFVGGPVRNEGVTAAEYMAVVAHHLGVPRAAIIVEKKSRDTYQNLLLSRDLIAPYGERAWLVTSALHMPRAMAVAANLGLQMQAYPCDYRAVGSMGWRAWLPNSDAVRMYSAALHELIGLGYYRFTGRAK